KNILAAGSWKHAAHFAIAHCCHYSHESGNKPNEYEPSGAAYISDNVSTYDKNSGTNHRTGNDHRCIKEAKAGFESSCLFIHKKIPFFKTGLKINIYMRNGN